MSVFKTITKAIVVSLTAFSAYSQPVNDNCSGAINIGTLPTPGACTAGLQNGTPITLNNQTTAGATAPALYTYQTGCVGGGAMTTFALDTWYSFVATGTTTNINITGFPNANVGIYDGTCGNLLGRGCTIIGASGTGTLVTTQILVGQTYYIQISGNTISATDNNFSIAIDNDIDCNDCLTVATLTANPLPVNGGYNPGQVVQFCYTVNNYNEVNTNWFHGVQVSAGPGWTGTFSAITPANDCNVDVTPGPGDAGDGIWSWYPAGVTSSANGSVWPAGFYFDNVNVAGTNAGNNFGDPGNCGWTFCWSLTVSAACLPGSSLAVSVNTTGDGESGSWPSAACADDPTSNFSAFQVCCTAPTMAATPVTCLGGANGTATATHGNGASPWDYSWTNSSGTNVGTTMNSVAASNTITGLIAGTYTVTITDNVGCVTTNTVIVNPGTLPVVNAGVDQTVCIGTAVTLSGAGASTYSWDNGVTNAAAFTPPSGLTTTITTYTVTGTSVAGCIATDQVIVTVNPLATVDANINQSVCALGNITLAGIIGGSATSSNWTAPSGSFSNAASLSSTYTPSIASGTVTLTLTTNDPTGPCAAVTDIMIVTVNPLPVIAVPDQIVCAGTAVTLSGNGATTYTWTGGITNGLQFTPAATANYTVTGTITATGCISTDLATITVNPLPIVGAGNNQTVCANTQVTLTGSGATTYSWNNGVTNGTAFTPPSGITTTTTTYTVTGTNTATGCTNTDQVDVIVNPIPIVNVGPDVSICIGSSATLTATGATSYSWAPGGQLTASITVNPAINTIYTVTGTSLGCSASDAVTVTISANAPINAGPDVQICAGSSTTITATGGVSYVWDNGLGIGNNFVVSPGTTTTYTVTGSNAAGCSGTDAMTVTVNPVPIVGAGLDQTVCAGTSVTLSGSGATTYTWNNGVTNGVAFTPTATATYTVTGTSLGCISTDQVIVTVNPLPIVGAGLDQTVCAGTAVTLTGTGATTYTWTGGISNGVSFTPAGTANYTVTGTTLGCINTDIVTVTVNPLPIVNAGLDQTVCSGTAVTLSGTGASTYTWDNGITNGIAFTQAVGTITYTVIGTAAGCTGTDQVMVTVNPNPVPIINGPSTYCTGNFALLSTSSPFATYTWSTGALTPTINATVANNPISVVVTNAFGCSGTSPVFPITVNNVITANFNVTICQGQSSVIHGISQTVAGVYSQTFVLPSGCDSVAIVTLTVNPLPTINAGVDQIVCTGVQTTLTATGAATYIWNNSITNGVPFTQAVGSVTYTVTGTSVVGCVNTDQVVVTVNPLPIVGAGVDQAVCTGVAVTLSGSGANTYIWNNGVINGAAFTPAASNTYTVTGTDLNGCVNTSQVVVTVNPIPIIGAGPDQTICIGASVTLSGSGASTYTWDNGVTNGTLFAPIATATYTVTGTSAEGCNATDQVVVTVNPIPVVNAGINQTICFGTSVTLLGTGTSTYTWTNGITNGIAFTPAVGTLTYTVTGTSAAGCVSTDQVDVIVNPLPIVGAGQDQSVCFGTAVTLSGSGAAAYSWNNGITDGVAFTPISTTTYTLTGTSAAGCTSTDQVIVTVNPIPVVFAGNDVAVCENQTVTLTGSGAATYSWNNGISNGIAFNPPAGTTTYTVTGTSAAGCINTDQVNVTLEPVPVVSFTPDVTFGCVTLTVNFTNTTPNSANCIWTMSDGTVLTGCTTVSNTFTQAGCYDITLTTTSTNGCVGTFTAVDLVCAEEAPIASFMPSASVISEMNPIVNFINTTTGAVNYVWNFGDNTPTSILVNPSHDYSSDPIGNYIVTLIAYSPAGCVDTAYSTIQIYEDLIFYVPNTFTPDNDDYNPTFQPIFTAGYDPYDYTLLIFNRWGEIVFESHNTEIGWDGSYGSNDEIDLVQDGTYTWKIEFKTTRNDERIMRVGHVNILR